MSRSAPLRPAGVRRGVVGAAVALVAVAAGSAPAGKARAAAASVPASTDLVTLLTPHVARASAGTRAHRVATVPALLPLTRARTVLPVLARATATDGRPWVRVRLPGRPNGHSGWIPTAGTRPSVTGWQLVVDRSARRVTAYREGHAERSFRAVVGKPSTPTPLGRFFVEEAVALSSRTAGAPFALATSARSEVLQEFEGGPGQIALHGTSGLAGAPGSAASHGCIRLSTPAITWLAARIGRGIPLTIQP